MCQRREMFLFRKVRVLFLPFKWSLENFGIQGGNIINFKQSKEIIKVSFATLLFFSVMEHLYQSLLHFWWKIKYKLPPATDDQSSLEKLSKFQIFLQISVQAPSQHCSTHLDWSPWLWAQRSGLERPMHPVPTRLSRDLMTSQAAWRSKQQQQPSVYKSQGWA